MTSPSGPTSVVSAALLGGVLHIDLGRIIWPFAETGGLAGILNAAVMTGVVLILTTLLGRAGLRLKL